MMAFAKTRLVYTSVVLQFTVQGGAALYTMSAEITRLFGGLDSVGILL